MQRALAAMSPWRGAAFRGAELSEGMISAYRDAAEHRTVLFEPGFISATAEPGVRFPGNALLVLASRGARDISAIAAAPQLREVVFPAGRWYAVLAVEDSPHGTGVFMTDLDETASLDDEDMVRTLRAAAQGRRGAAVVDAPQAFIERCTGPVGLDDGGVPFPVPPRPLANAADLDALIGASQSAGHATPELIAALRGGQLLAVLADPARPMLLPANVDGREVLPLYTNADRLRLATGGRFAHTRAPVADLLRGVPESMPVVLYAAQTGALELSAQDVAAVRGG